ncbi:hypothetical protein Dda_0051 [Drechslerella dactyloides]|uniref:Uncharacterized protein n=1 Tax=Drechslerella dactyloides TaxID=74499 RepID=A0AAD6J5H9_DREDA|nr:hypothetical protein Dda_0051 [Drechslerella dactyloides]
MTTPSSPLSMDAKTKFQQLWAQFGTAFMEEPMRDHEKRVEELVRENERLRLELSTAKNEQTKTLENQQNKFHELHDENESLRQEVTNEVRSGIERVQERNQALALAKKENTSLKLVINNQDAIWAQERAKYKQTIKLLRDELESAVTAHERLRKNIGVLRGEITDGDILEDTDSELDLEDEGDIENEAELQLQTERSLRSSAYRRANRRQQVEETPGLDGSENGEQVDDDGEELEYELDPEEELLIEGEEDGADADISVAEGEENDEADRQLEAEDAPGPSRRQSRVLKPRDSETRTSENTETEKSIQTEQTEPALRRSTRIRNSDVITSEIIPTTLSNDTIELVGMKRGRDQSSDIATTDGGSQIPDHQAEYELAPPPSLDPDDPTERPSKRTRRQTERYINALESTRNMAKIMTPPATSPTFLPSVLPRRSANRSPARRSTALAQTTTNTPKPRRSSTLKSPGLAPPPPKQDSTPAKSPTKSPKSPKSAKKQIYPKHMFDFILVSGYKHGRNLIVEDASVRDLMEPLLEASTERIRDVAVTPGFWRSYAHKRNIVRKDAGLTPHCAYTSQFPLDSDEVELEEPWSNGLDYACDNCIKEGIACFTVGERIDTEKYGAVYRPPKKA